MLAGDPDLPEGDGDDAGLVGALRRRGLHARWVSWDDPATLDADLVILRAAPDYVDRLDEFLAWTRRVRHLLNPPAAVAWNTDRRYRVDLERRGVPIAASRFVGEVTALVFVAGAQSHAFSRAAEKLRPADADWELWDLGRQTLSAAAAHLGLPPEHLLCARVDVIGGRDEPGVLALELVAPSLGWRQLDAATRAHRQRDFALAVEAALERFGLGPLSHRRP